MSNELFDDIIQKTRTELPYIENITLSGFGEFSFDPDWRYKVSECSEYFKTVHIVTNASLLTKDDLMFLLDNVDDIRISMYATDGDAYNKIHNPDRQIDYNEITAKIDFLMNRRNDNQRIILNYLEISANKHQTRDWISYWDNKVDLIEVWKPHNWITAKNYRMLSDERLKTCGRLENGPIQVQVDGTVNVCCFDYNGEMLIGDLRAQSFGEIFNGSAMNRIQELHMTGRADELQLCKICDQRNDMAEKVGNALYNSKFDIESRIDTTSTDYDQLL